MCCHIFKHINPSHKMPRIFSLALKLILLIVLFSGCTVQQVQQTLDEYLKQGQLSSSDVAAGLREALITGITRGANTAGKTDGYLKNPNIRIPFPPEVQKVEKKLRDIGLGREVDKFVTALNRGAEQAARESKPVFIAAIKSMTINDAWGILKGTDKQAATSYLKRTTSVELKKKFDPIISRALNSTSATKYYADIVTRYNKIPFVSKVNPDLKGYASDKAIEGLFFMVAKEELKIRKDPLARTSELMKRVFREQD